MTRDSLALLSRLANAPIEFARSEKGRDLATRAYELTTQEYPDDADAFLVELTMLGYVVKRVP